MKKTSYPNLKGFPARFATFSLPYFGDSAPAESQVQDVDVAPMQHKKPGKRVKLSLLSWIIIPFLIAWISINYIVGTFHRPAWETSTQSSGLTTTEVNAKEMEQVVAKTTVPAFTWHGTGLVTFWFDDAWLTQYTTAYPLLSEAGYKGSIAVPTRYVGDDDYMTWPQIHKVQFNGWEIDSHSRNHICNINALTDSQLESEIAGSKQDLLQEGIPVENYVTPCGYSSQKVTTLIKHTYTSLRTSDQGLNDLPVSSPYDIKTYAIESTTTEADVAGWLSDAEKTHSWLILLFHQVDTTGSKFSISPQHFRAIISEVKKSHLPVVLPSQVLGLIDAREETSE